MPANVETIHEFVEALKEEIFAAKRSGSGTRARLLDGRLIDQTPGLFIYSFYVENVLALPDDTPVEVVIGERSTKGYVIQIKGLEVIVGIEEKQGDSIPEAILVSNLSYLLEILKSQYEDVIAGISRIDFSIAEDVFSNRHAKAKESKELPLLDYQEGRLPNQSQAKATKSSFRMPVTYIWGPPGTGKTRTLADIVQLNMKLGKRTLVVAHSNAAVDEVTEDVAVSMCNSELYKENRIIRLGNCSKESLKNSNREVLMKVAEEKRNSDLSAELTILSAESEELNDRKQQLEELKAIFIRIDGLLEGVANRGRQSLKKKEEEVRVTLEIKELDLKITNLKHKQKNGEEAGILRLLVGRNPERLQQKMDDATSSLEGLRAKLITTMQEQEAIRKDKIADEEELIQLSSRKEVLIGLLGVQELQLGEEMDKVNSKIGLLGERRIHLEQLLREVQKTIINEAMVVCTTLTKTFTDKLLEDTSFETLILDEASMAPLPHFYWSLGKCRERVVVAGDFLQLPPICLSDQGMATKWFGRNIYDHINLRTPEAAERDGRVSPLVVQYRMHPDICYVINSMFYGGMLQDGPNTFGNKMEYSISDKPLVLVDTTAADPWCSRLTFGSRFNIYTALLAVELAVRALNESSKRESIAIITPYKAQARLIGKMLEEKGLSRSIEVSTIHRFQGGESDMVIFDLVEGPVHNVTPMIDDTKDGSNAKLLINVALSRAKNKAIVIANTRYIHDKVSPQAVINQILAAFKSKGEVKDSIDIIDSYFARDFVGWINEFTECEGYQLLGPQQSSLFNERSFYPFFIEDMKQAESEVIIFSPFLTKRRFGQLEGLLRVMIDKGVSIIVFTRPEKQHPNTTRHEVNEILDHMERIGIKTIQRSRMHQKIAIIDRGVTWEGSLNILSHRDTSEQMRRFESEEGAEELIRDLEIEESLNLRLRDNGIEASQGCPECEGKLIIKQSKYSPFLVCSTRGCEYRLKIDEGEELETEKRCDKCEGTMLFRTIRRRNFLRCPNCKKSLPV